MTPTRPRKPYARPRGSDGAWLHDRAPLSSAKGNGAVAPLSNTKLVVSNLHYEITPKDLVSIFGQIGTLVREPHIRGGVSMTAFASSSSVEMNTELNLKNHLFAFKYDRSGRSSGVAIISYEKSADASRAKKEYEGKLAKGQPMEIAFDTAPPRQRSTSMPGRSTASLLDRVERPSLAERLRNSDDAKRSITSSTGPIRARAPRSARAGPALRSKVGRPSRPKAKTAEELDKELDVFMADDGKDAPANSETKVVEPVAAPQDVEMA